MNKLMVNGTKNIEGKEVKVIEGGFGKNQKCILASDVATMHEVETKYINKVINNNKERFNENDLVDFLGSFQELRDFAKENGLITSNRTENIYLLSERGYTKLVAMMSNNNEKKWFVMDKLIDEYFTMREIINSDEQLKKELAYKLLLGGIDSIEAHKKLTEIEVKNATQPLLNKIEEDKPLVQFTNKVLKSKDNILIRELAKIVSDEVYKIGQNRLYDKLRELGMIFKNSTEPYQKFVDNGVFVVEEKTINTPYGVKITKTTKVTPLGQVKIIEKLRKDYEEENK